MSGQPEDAAPKSVHDLLKVWTERDPRFQSMVVSYFTIDERWVTAIDSHLPNMVLKGGSWHPYGCTIVKIGAGAKLGQFKTIVVSGPPKTLLHPARYELELPEAHYLILFSPIITFPDGSTNDSIARDTISMALSLLMVFGGRGVVLTYVGDEVISAGKETPSIVGEVIRVIDPIDVLTFTDSEVAVKQVLEGLRDANAGIKNQLLFALNLFGRAVRESNDSFRFTLYSIALEVLAQGKGKEITLKLAAAYGESKKFAEEDLETKAFIRFRDRLIHQGSIETLHSRMERLLQCYFIDLMRARLRLPCERLTAQMRKAIDDVRHQHV